MTRLHALAHALLIVPLFTPACGDDSNRVIADVAATDVAPSDALPGDSEEPDAADAGPDTTVPDTVDTSTTADTATDATTDAASDDVILPDTTEPEPPRHMATITVGGVATDVTPAIRRGVLVTDPVATFNSVSIGETNVLTCPGEGGLAEGARAIRVTSVSIAGSFAANCGGPSNFDLGEENMRFTASQACDGRTGSCSVDLNENFQLRFVGCSYGAASFSVYYECRALMPAPSFVLEVPTDFGTLRVDALDGLGDLGCVDRAARATLNGQPVVADLSQPCRIAIDRRGPTLLDGHIEATLTLGGSAVPLAISFSSNQTETRNAIQVFLEDDFCFTTDLTASVTTEGADTFDTFTGGAFNCLQQPQRAPAPVTVAIRRPRSGESFDASEHNGRVRLTQGALTANAGQRGTFYSIDHAATRERFNIQGVQFCDGAGENCGSELRIFYFQASR